MKRLMLGILLAANAPCPTSIIYDGPPPARFAHPGTNLREVSFGAVEASCGDWGPNVIVYACTRTSGVYMPNPCDFQQERFAMLMCHELAHQDGWPRTHGE